MAISHLGVHFKARWLIDVNGSLSTERWGLEGTDPRQALLW